MLDGHLTDIELQNRASFRLPLREGMAIDDHLRTCSECVARYRDLTKDQPWAPPLPKPSATHQDARGDENR